MRYIILVLGLAFLTACSPKYKVVKEYHPPKIVNSGEASVCLGLCESKQNLCKSKCEEAFSSCKVKAHRIANQRYASKMQHYTAKLERYVEDMDPFDYDIRFYGAGYYGFPFYYPRYGYGYANSLFWYDPMPYYHHSPKPKKPSLEEEKLKAEAEFCDLDCGCAQKFDICYIGCGGKVISKKLCIENCQ